MPFQVVYVIMENYTIHLENNAFDMKGDTFKELSENHKNKKPLINQGT